MRKLKLTAYIRRTNSYCKRNNSSRVPLNSINATSSRGYVEEATDLLFVIDPLIRKNIIILN